MRARILATLATTVVTAAVLAAGPVGAVTIASPPVAVAKGAAPLTVPCGPNGTSVAADWYLPQGVAPTGVVWLQHGFFRRNANVTGLAQSIARSTRSVVVAPTISSNFLDPTGCWINGTAMHRAVARMLGDRFPALQTSASTAAAAAGVPAVALPPKFVLAGHSAGGNLATSAAGFTTQLTVDGAAGSPLVVSRLRGVVMLDGVESGGAMATGLARLSGPTSRPVYTVAAPASVCNAADAGTRVLQQARPGQFVGVRLAGGSHVDAEGGDGDALAWAVCGKPTLANVQGLRALAAGWIGDLLAGTQRPELLYFTAPGTQTTLPSGAIATTL